MKSRKPARPINDGYQLYYGIKGYQPTEGNFNINNPPQGGSGLPSKPPTSSRKKRNWR